MPVTIAAPSPDQMPTDGTRMVQPCAVAYPAVAARPELSIGEETVKTHVSNILSKLHLADRTQAAIYGLQRLVSLDDALE